MDGNNDGLNALREIVREINAQDEKIWRREAREKYLKEEIDKLQIQINDYETRIQMFKTDRAHTCTDEILEFLNISMNGQILRIQSQASVALALDFEIEQRKKDLILWQEKYDEVISKFQQTYEDRLAFHEETNPAFKECRQLDKSIKMAEFELKYMKAKLDARKRSKRQLELIRKQIEQANIVHFAESVIEKKNHQQIKLKLKEAEEKKKKVLVEMFELQEKLKRRPFQTNPISSGLSLLNKQTTSTGSMRIVDEDIRKMREKFTVREFPGDKQKFQRIQSTNPEEEIKMEDNQQSKTCIILSNDELKPTKVISKSKQLILPPLKSILGSQLNFNKKFSRASVKSNIIPNTKTENYERNRENTESTNDVLESEKTSQVISNTPITQIDTIKSGGLSSEYLNNLKFTTQLPSDRMYAQKPKYIQLENKEIFPNAPNPASTIDSKRKLSQVGNIDTMFPPQKKSVNFARPIEIPSSINQSQESSTTENLCFLEPNTQNSRYSQESNQNEKSSYFMETNSNIYSVPGRPEGNNKNEKNSYFLETNANAYNFQDVSNVEENLSMSLGSGQLNFSGDDFQPTVKPLMSPPFSGPLFGASGERGATSFNFSLDAVSKSMKETWDLFN